MKTFSIYPGAIEAHVCRFGSFGPEMGSEYNFI